MVVRLGSILITHSLVIIFAASASSMYLRIHHRDAEVAEMIKRAGDFPLHPDYPARACCAMPRGVGRFGVRRSADLSFSQAFYVPP